MMMIFLANIVSYDINYDDHWFDPSPCAAWAAARLTRGCGEQAFGEVKHLKMMIAMVVIGF